MAGKDFHSMPFNVAEFESEVVRSMRSVGLNEELIYAFKASGVLVTKDNEHLVRPEDLAAWDAAIEEFRQR